MPGTIAKYEVPHCRVGAAVAKFFGVARFRLSGLLNAHRYAN